MGPTGVGKTEIARRLAKLMDAPFVKVEATKFTEVGYVGRDVDSMVRDLVEAAIRITKQKRLQEKYSIAEEIAEEFGLEITTFEKKDGWQLWHRSGGRPYNAFTNSSADFGDNYQEIGKIDEADFIENEVMFFFEDTKESFEQIESFLKQKKEIWEEVEKMDDDEIVITHEGRYSETIKKESMCFYHDTKHIAIGLI